MEANIPPIISSRRYSSIVSTLKHWIIDESHVVLCSKPRSGITPEVEGPPFPDAFVLGSVQDGIANQEPKYCKWITFWKMVSLPPSGKKYANACNAFVTHDRILVPEFPCVISGRCSRYLLARLGLLTSCLSLRLPLEYDEAFKLAVVKNFAEICFHGSNGAVHGDSTRVLFDLHITTGLVLIIPTALVCWLSNGTLWAVRLVPTHRFVKFCFWASIEWIHDWREVQRSL